MRLSVSVAVIALVGACTGNPIATPSAVPGTTPGATATAPATATSTAASPGATTSGPLATVSPSAVPATGAPSPVATSAVTDAYEYQEYDVPAGSHLHDVAPAPDGSVCYTGQNVGTLGRLDPATGEVTEIALGEGSAPHGVIVGPDGAAWITDGGLNAIVRVEGTDVQLFPLPRPSNANLNTAAFDGDGILWFTGQNGVYGRVTPDAGDVEVFDAPRGAGPYGIDSTPSGHVWFVSLAGSYLAQRQMLGREGELWGAESATDKLVVLRRTSIHTDIN